MKIYTAQCVWTSYKHDPEKDTTMFLLLEQHKQCTHYLWHTTIENAMVVW